MYILVFTYALRELYEIGLSQFVMYRISRRWFPLLHVLFVEPLLDYKRSFFVLQTFAQQRFVCFEFVVVVVQDVFETFFQFRPEAFANRVSFEI